MKIKRIILIIGAVAVATAVITGLGMSAMQNTFGIKVQTIQFNGLSADIQQGVLSSLGLEEAEELWLVYYGGPDKFYEYALTVPCDDVEEFLSGHSFIADNFTYMGNSRTLFPAGIENAGYYTERDSIVIVVDKCSYHEFEEQTELIKRLGDFNISAQTAFENYTSEEK